MVAQQEVQKNLWAENVKLLEIDLNLQRERGKILSDELNKEKQTVGCQTLLYDEQELRTEIRQLHMQLDSEQTYSNQIAQGHRSTVFDMDNELKRKEATILDLRKQIGELMVENSRLKSIPDQDRDYKLHKQQNQLDQQRDQIQDLKAENDEIRKYNEENISRINQLKNIIVHLEGQNRQVFVQSLNDRKFVGMTESKSERKLNAALKDFKRLTNKSKVNFQPDESRDYKSKKTTTDLRSNVSHLAGISSVATQLPSSVPLRQKSKGRKSMKNNNDVLEKILEE